MDLAPVQILLSVLLGAELLAAQEVVVELTPAQATAAGIEFQREQNGGRVTMVRWVPGELEIEIPLAEPVEQCVVGLAGDGKELVILAGGVAASLDLYIVPDDGDFFRYPTEGGRRLPRRFNGGQGSWPVLEGRHLVFFAYDLGGNLEFRVVDFAGVLLGSRQRLSLGVDEWRIESDPDVGEVRVDFGIEIPPLTFNHPLAPRLETSRGLVDFKRVRVGRRGRQLLGLSNTGRRPLHLRIEVPEPFELSGEAAKTLAPGETHRVTLEFAPDRGGDFEQRMQIFSSGLFPEHLVVLRGVGVEVEEEIVARAPPPPPPVPALGVGKVMLYPLGGGRVLVLGQVERPFPDAVVLRAENGQEHAVGLDGEGRFHIEMEAAPGTPIQGFVELLDGRRSAGAYLAQVPAMLEVVDGSAAVRCLPGQAFLLVAFHEETPLRSWRAKADEDGRCLVSLDILGEMGEEEISLAVVVVGEDGLRVSPRVQVR